MAAAERSSRNISPWIVGGAAAGLVIFGVALGVRERSQGLSRRKRQKSVTMRKEELLASRRHHFAKNLSVSFTGTPDGPLCVMEAHGCYLHGADGKRVLDCVNNVATVGHSHPRLAEVAQEQLLAVNTNTRYLHPARIRYARKLLATFPPDLQDGVLFLVNSGSEANDLALRLARTYTQSEETIVLAAAYHGHTQACIDISPYKFLCPGGTGPKPYIHQVDAPDTFRGRYRGEDAGVRYAEQVRGVCQAIAGKRQGRVGAFIAESVLGCGGQLVLPPGYLKAAFTHVREFGGVCIADEVQVGFGRVGSHFWAFQTQDVVPDIVTLGKPMGNGFPLGGVVVRRDIAEAFNNGMEYFNTFGGSNLSCAMGEAVLDIIQEEGLQVGNYAKKELRALQGKHSRYIGEVRGLGLFLGIEMMEDHRPSEKLASFIIAHCFTSNGVQVSSDGPLHNVIKIKPPLCFSRQDVDLLVHAIDCALQDYGRDKE